MNELLEFAKWLITNYGIGLFWLLVIFAVFAYPNTKGILINNESKTEIERRIPNEVNINTFPKGRKRDAPVFSINFKELHAWAKRDKKQFNYFLLALFALGLSMLVYCALMISYILAVIILVAMTCIAVIVIVERRG